MSSWPPDAGREVIGATHIFVLRLSLDRGDGGSRVARVRIEDVETGEVKHFNEIESGIDQLRGWLLRLAASRSDGAPGGEAGA